MVIGILLSGLCGVIGLLQGALNKQMSIKIGVTHAVLINMVLTFIFSIAFYYFTLKFPRLVPEMFRLKAPLLTWHWWYIFPGILGMLIVSLVPWAIHEAGMVKFTIVLVAAQMIFSVFWDMTIDKIPVNTTKTLGMILCLGGTFLIVYKK